VITGVVSLVDWLLTVGTVPESLSAISAVSEAVVILRPVKLGLEIVASTVSVPSTNMSFKTGTVSVPLLAPSGILTVLPAKSV